ncbi:toxin glutamine deamidase domain-containing protein [Salinispora arenicola]|uniref:toxin glutamine deamidase domain-containing protein n=1 Tax=Salinispora arenicola TaxID=168697 RepID=UPI0012BBDAA9|nr:toxin glutamine deamidase domain-containing protein [Salinispora arenicola]
MNPSSGDAGEFVTNCVLTAIATDMTLADRFDPATAADHAHYQAPPTTAQPATDLTNYTGNTYRDVPDYQAIDDVMRAAPVGSRAIVVVTDTAGYTSHAFNVVRDDHGIAYLDGQAGGWATAPRQPARIRFMPLTDRIPEPDTVANPPASPGSDLVGAIGLEIEVPVVLRSDTVELGYADVIAQGPGITIKVDTDSGEKIPEVIAHPGAVLPGETRPDGSAAELEQRALTVAQALQVTPNTEAPLHTLLEGLDGFEVVDKGHHVVVHPRPTPDGQTPRPYTQYTLGVPPTGLRPALELAMDSAWSRRHTHITARLLHDALTLADLFEASAPQQGRADTDTLTGVLALTYPHIAALIVKPQQSLIKSTLLVASRMSFRAIRSGLPQSVRDFLTQHAGQIRTEFVTSIWQLLTEMHGEQRAHRVMQRNGMLFDQDAPGPAPYRLGGLANDYLNNLLFDRYDEQGTSVPFIDQCSSVGIYAQFHELDTQGGLPYPLIAIEFRYHNPRVDLNGIPSTFEQLAELAAALAPTGTPSAN